MGNEEEDGGEELEIELYCELHPLPQGEAGLRAGSSLARGVSEEMTWRICLFCLSLGNFSDTCQSERPSAVPWEQTELQ